MIGKTALALAAAAFIATSAALLMGAAALALFWALQPMLIPAGAAACVAGAALFVLLIALGIARAQHIGHRDVLVAQPTPHFAISSISGAIKERPLLLLGLAGLTGIAALRSPDVLKSVVEALLPPHPRA